MVQFWVQFMLKQFTEHLEGSDWLVHSILPIGPHSYVNTFSLPPDILYTFLPKTLKMGQTNDPETLVINKKLTPGNTQQILSNILRDSIPLQLAKWLYLRDSSANVLQMNTINSSCCRIF